MLVATAAGLAAFTGRPMIGPTHAASWVRRVDALHELLIRLRGSGALRWLRRRGRVQSEPDLMSQTLLTDVPTRFLL